MKRVLTALMLCACFPGAAFAQTCGTTDLVETISPDERAELDAYVAPHVYPEGNVWKARRGDETVVVVGTLHIPDPRLDSIVEKVAPFVQDADLLILEATAEDQAGLAGLAATKPEMFFLNDGPTLIDLLTEDEWAQVTERVNQLGVPAFFAAKFQPWYLNLTLAMPPCAMALIQSGDIGLDRRLERIAVEESVPVAALDDVEALLGVFASDTMEDQLASLRLTLTTQFDTQASASTLMQAYFDERVREGWEFARILIKRAEIDGGVEMFDKLDEALLVGRNEDWETKLPDLLEGRDVVIAVGAAHLSGDSGVLRALERMGFGLERL